MTNAPNPSPTEDDIRHWLVARLAERLSVDPAAINLEESLTTHGLDSMQFVVLVGELEDWLGCRFNSNPLITYPSVNALSAYLARRLAAGATELDPARE